MHRYYAVIDTQTPISELTLSDMVHSNEDLFLQPSQSLSLDAPTMAHVNAVAFQVIVNPN